MANHHSSSPAPSWLLGRQPGSAQEPDLRSSVMGSTSATERTQIVVRQRRSTASCLQNVRVRVVVASRSQRRRLEGGRGVVNCGDSRGGVFSAALRARRLASCVNSLTCNTRPARLPTGRRPTRGLPGDLDPWQSRVAFRRGASPSEAPRRFQAPARLIRARSVRGVSGDRSEKLLGRASISTTGAHLEPIGKSTSSRTPSRDARGRPKVRSFRCQRLRISAQRLARYAPGRNRTCLLIGIFSPDEGSSGASMRRCRPVEASSAA